MLIQAELQDYQEVRPAPVEERRFDCDSATVLGKLHAYGRCLVEGPRNSGKTLLLKEIAQKAGLIDIPVISIDANTIPSLPEADVEAACNDIHELDGAGVVIVDHFDNLVMSGKNDAINSAREAVLEALDGKRLVIATDGRPEGMETRNALFTEAQRHEFASTRRGLYI